MSDIPYEEIEYFRPKMEDYIIAYYDIDKISPEDCKVYHEELRKVFPSNCVLSLPQNYYQLTGLNKSDMIQQVFSLLRYTLSKDEYEEAIIEEFHKLVGDDLK